MNKFIKISELSKMLKLTSSSNQKPQNHILRYWEKEFKQIKPKKINNQRHYSLKQVEIIKLIKFLIKNKGMTIKGVKEILNINIKKLDDYNSHSLKAEYYINKFKLKSKSLLERINKLKNYGKKNSP